MAQTSALLLKQPNRGIILYCKLGYKKECLQILVKNQELNNSLIIIQYFILDGIIFIAQNQTAH